MKGSKPLWNFPIPIDRHVLAAAILGRAGTIVTYNLKDFPDSALSPFGISAQHPDEFIEHAFDLSPASVCKAVHDQRASLNNPPRTVEELFDTYLQQGLGNHSVGPARAFGIAVNAMADQVTATALANK